MFDKAVWNNPITWTEKVVGNKYMFMSLLFLQLLLGCSSVGVFLLLSYKLFGHMSFPPFAILIILGMVLLPIAYLFALRRLFIKYKQISRDNELLK